MKPITSYTDAELSAEIDRRRHKLDAAPKPNPNPDFTALRNWADDLVKRRAARTPLPKDYEYRIFESLMQITYGPGFWEWWNKQEKPSRW